MSYFSAISAAVAELIRAVAWPGLALFLLIRYRDHVGRLIDRLRKGGPAEFDPLPPPQRTATGSLAPGAIGSDSAVSHIRTEAVVNWEEQLREMPQLRDEHDHSKREEVLLTLAVKALLVACFERAEGVMYASQVELLTYLNARPVGESAERLRELFYAPAATRFPETYHAYPFENYLGFLKVSLLVRVDDLHVSITPEGRDYLVWRLEQKKPPRIHG